MHSIPDKVAATYTKFKGSYPFFIALKRIRGKYYLYKQTTRIDKTLGKQKTITNYIGRITDEGILIKKESSVDALLENAKTYIEAHGGKVTLPKRSETGELVPIVKKPLTR